MSSDKKMEDDVEEVVVMEEGGETVTLDELVKRMTEIEKLTVTMGWALEKCIRTGLERHQTTTTTTMTT